MLGIIAGYSLQTILPPPVNTFHRNTPFGAPSAPICSIRWGGHDVLALPRHGRQNQVVAHLVNYRANIWALKELGVTRIVSIANAGGINSELRAGDFCVPDQIIDYTYGRAHTYVGLLPKKHFDFLQPFDENIRQALITYLPKGNQDSMHVSGTYGAMNGPRVETLAEVKRLKQDGCDVVGMTLMPEVALARELEIQYAALCFVSNTFENAKLDIAETEERIEKGKSELVCQLNSVVELLH